jgi:imidazolonepropionase-like amidohydrolase
LQNKSESELFIGAIPRLNALTWNGACATEVQNDLGCIAKGKIANLILTNPIRPKRIFATCVWDELD